MNHPLTGAEPRSNSEDMEGETPPEEVVRPGYMPAAPWAEEIVVGTCRSCHRPNNAHSPYCVHVNDGAD